MDRPPKNLRAPLDRAIAFGESAGEREDLADVGLVVHTDERHIALEDGEVHREFVEDAVLIAVKPVPVILVLLLRAGCAGRE